MREDYFECLHHRKEYDMVSTVMAQEKRNEEMRKSGGTTEGDGMH
jgi:hypothetical protein